MPTRIGRVPRNLKRRNKAGQMCDGRGRSNLSLKALQSLFRLDLRLQKQETLPGAILVWRRERSEIACELFGLSMYFAERVRPFILGHRPGGARFPEWFRIKREV